jgi:hypothetical protein
MNPVRGVKGIRGEYKASDGQKFDRLAFANAHQRDLNGAARIKKLVVQFGMSSDGSRCNPANIIAEMRHNPCFRKRFMLAVNY